MDEGPAHLENGEAEKPQNEENYGDSPDHEPIPRVTRLVQHRRDMVQGAYPANHRNSFTCAEAGRR